MYCNSSYTSKDRIWNALCIKHINLYACYDRHVQVAYTKDICISWSNTESFFIHFRWWLCVSNITVGDGQDVCKVNFSGGAIAMWILLVVVIFGALQSFKKHNKLTFPFFCGIVNELLYIPENQQLSYLTVKDFGSLHCRSIRCSASVNSGLFASLESRNLELSLFDWWIHI